MATLTKEHREYQQFDMVKMLVREARRNQEISRKYGEPEDSDKCPSVEKLIESLTRQAANRIYFGPDGHLRSTKSPEEIVHIGGNITSTNGLTVVNNLVYCRYYQSTLGGPRYIGLGVESDFKIQDGEDFDVLPDPPDFLIRHATPFAEFAR